MKDYWERYHLVLGQVSGYGAGAASWFDLAKDLIGFIGLIAAATCSVLALWEKVKKKKDSDGV